MATPNLFAECAEELLAKKEKTRNPFEGLRKSTVVKQPFTTADLSSIESYLEHTDRVFQVNANVLNDDNHRIRRERLTGHKNYKEDKPLKWLLKHFIVRYEWCILRLYDSDGNEMFFVLSSTMARRMRQNSADSSSTAAIFTNENEYTLGYDFFHTSSALEQFVRNYLGWTGPSPPSPPPPSTPSPPTPDGLIHSLTGLQLEHRAPVRAPVPAASTALSAVSSRPDDTKRRKIANDNDEEENTPTPPPPTPPPPPLPTTPPPVVHQEAELANRMSALSVDAAQVPSGSGTVVSSRTVSSGTAVSSRSPDSKRRRVNVAADDADEDDVAADADEDDVAADDAEGEEAAGDSGEYVEAVDAEGGVVADDAEGEEQRRSVITRFLTVMALTRCRTILTIGYARLRERLILSWTLCVKITTIRQEPASRIPDIWYASALIPS